LLFCGEKQLPFYSLAETSFTTSLLLITNYNCDSLFSLLYVIQVKRLRLLRLLLLHLVWWWLYNFPNNKNKSITYNLYTYWFKSDILLVGQLFNYNGHLEH